MLKSINEHSSGKCILITGGAGFIGSNFIKHIIEQHNMFDKIVILDKLTYAGDLNLIKHYLSDDILFYSGDICDGDLVYDIISKHMINTIVNFAAESHVDRSIENQSDFMNTNIIGVQILMNQAKKYWFDEKTEKYLSGCKFIQISTDEVYGSSNKTDDLVFYEDSHLSPSNPYSATKASAEHMINANTKTFNFPAVIIRSSNNYGMSQNSEKLIPKVISKIIKNQDIPLYGDGMHKRNWLNVTDNCEGIMKVVLNGEIGEIYNIAGNHQLTNLDLVNKIIDITEICKKQKYKGNIIFVKDRPGHDYSYRISGDKIKNELGFVPQTDINNGLLNLISETLSLIECSKRNS